MPYQIGVTPANMQELTDLGLPDPLYQPLNDFTPFSGTKLRGDGLVVGTGLPRFVWRFEELTISQMGILLYYVTTAGVLQASKVVYARTRIPTSNMTDRIFQSYKAVMVAPLEPENVRYATHRKYLDAQVQFVQAVAI